MKNQAVCQPEGVARDAFARPQPVRLHRWTHRTETMANGLKGMLAEILFCMGLILIGFMISLIGGR